MPQDSDLSSVTTLRSIEVRIPPGRPKVLQASLCKVKQILSTIASPVFSEVVIILRQLDIPGTEPLAAVLRELYGVKEFRVAFCLEIVEELRVKDQRTLTLEMRNAVRTGLYDFLPSPPLVFSRHIAEYDDHLSYY